MEVNTGLYRPPYSWYCPALGGQYHNEYGDQYISSDDATSIIFQVMVLLKEIK